MSQNKTIKQGDLVRYHIGLESISSQGFGLGQFYMVMQDSAGLFVAVNSNKVYLTIGNDLTDYCDHVSKHACPVVCLKVLTRSVRYEFCRVRAFH